MEATTIVSTIVNAGSAFVQGLGQWFLKAFQVIFMNATGSGESITYSGLNPLGIFILIMFGISLGYGVIRWITGLFRKEAK